jgi:endonuclease G, mitochondrial
MVEWDGGTDSKAAAEQNEAAAARIEARREEREAKLKALEEGGGIAAADSPARVAARLDRLSRYWSRAPLPAGSGEAAAGSPQDVISAALSRGTAWSEVSEAEATLETAGKILERVVGTPDFVGINYLETGLIASRAIGRVNVVQGGQPAGYGTGSMIAPGVLMTNHHVLEDAETADGSTIEFEFEDGPDGQPRQSRRFRLDPERLFVADEPLDFALVAVDPSGGDLAKYGYNPLIGATGKAIVGEPVTIIQHPKGERKQIVLRNNRILDIADDFLYYETDTEPGSSGSLVFNGQWEVVALHHAGVRTPHGQAAGEYVNEGIRISRIVEHLEGLSLDGDAATLRDSVVRASGGRPLGSAQEGSEGPAPAPSAGLEAVTIDPDYSNRRGYDPAFLGNGERSVPLPQLSAEQLANAAKMKAGGSGEQDGHVLPYHHFSVVLNKERRLAYFTAVNIDGALARRLQREPDKWSLDPRIPAEDQTGEPVYVDNDLDRGHLVRRLDPAWGESAAAAKIANDDTFHFTNCAPQHGQFNQNKTTWAGLEDHILDNADNEDFKVNVFSGPVFAADDDEYRGVKLPKQFWKVVVMAKSPGLLSATAYLLSQESLIDGLEVAAEFSFGAYKTFQVPVSEIERLTGLSLGSLPDFDPLAAQETTAAYRELETEAEAIL